jgi:hypothetical protein
LNMYSNESVPRISRNEHSNSTRVLTTNGHQNDGRK